MSHPSPPHPHSAASSALPQALPAARPPTARRPFFSPRGAWRYLTSGEASLFAKLLFVATLVYVVSPVDAVPDVAPIIGWLDDLGVFAIAVAYLSRKAAEHERGPVIDTHGE